MRKFKYLAILFLVTHTAFAQIKITGIVKDNRSKPLKSVSISILNTYDGATSDSAGKFIIKTYEKGTFTIEAKSLGYKTATQTITIAKDAIQIQFQLKEEVSELKAVTVTASSFEAGDKKRAATVLSALDIYTTGGANADISTAVKTLPGAQQIGEQEGLFIRGGTGAEAKQMMDGMVINNPYFSGSPDIATRGRFSASLFKGNVFSTGGYSALYGQALSGILLLESIDLPQASEATASISPLFAGIGLQKLAHNKKSSWGANYGYTNVGAYFKVVKQTPDYFTTPQYHGGDANFRIKTKKNGMLKFFTTFSAGKLGLRNPDIDSVILKDAFSLTNSNWYNNLSYRNNLGKGWKLQAGLSYSINIDDINLKIQNANNQNITTGVSYIDYKNFAVKNSQSLSQGRIVFEKRLKGISALRIGTEHWYNYSKSTYNSNNTIIKDNYTALFSETDIYLTNNLAAKAGLRYEYSTLVQKANIAPRISLAYKTGQHGQMSLSYGEFYQNPDNTQLINTATGSIKQIGYTKSTHYLINYIKSTSAQTFRLEVFYKKYNNLVKTIPDTSTSGNGYAKGFEIFWRDKKTLKNIDYWISYSYLDTKREFLNYPTQLRPTFAAPHTISIITKTFIPKIKTGFNFSYSFATGRPYYNINYNGTSGKYEIKDEGTTINYSNLGFSLNWLPNLGKSKAKTNYVVVASVTNILNQDQVFGYRYSYNGNNKVAVTTPARQFYFIGVFFSWGVDRSQDAINNNL